VHLAEGKSLTLGDRDWTYKLLCELLFAESPEWNVPSLAQRHAHDAREPMALVAEAFARGNAKTDGFKSRIVPVPVAIMRELFRERPKAIAPDLVKDIAAVDLALRNGLATVAAGGAREKVKKEHYSRTLPARAALQRQADMLFFPELWRRMAATSDAELGQLRYAFLERLAAIARAEFGSALSSIPCPSLMRPRAEVRGRQALEYGLARAMKDLKPEETHVEA
jgi:CRISPR system Cascade subunit CasA